MTEIILRAGEIVIDAAELEDARIDASDTAGQLRDALGKLAAAEQRERAAVDAHMENIVELGYAIVRREEAESERDAARAEAVTLQAENERLREVLRGIQAMAEDDLRLGAHENSWQIEADARAALSPDNSHHATRARE